MAGLCPIDLQFEREISALLSTPSPGEIKEYYDDTLKQRECNGITVELNDKVEKGVYAASHIREDELILKDQIIVGAQHSYNKIDCLICSFCFRFIGSIELQIGRKLYFKKIGRVAANDCSNGLTESLINGELELPYSEQFALPPAVSCLGGCEETYYCSETCAKLDWEVFHSLLCTGENSDSLHKSAMLKFIDHAYDTNDIFIVVAKAISSTILKYRKLKAAYLRDTYTAVIDPSICLTLLLEAWKPFAMGHKRRWWECIDVPDDIDYEDSGVFRSQVRELAFTSLQLLKEAIFDKECAPLFSLEIYGHLIGMFELNNLDLVVASPVEDYFLYIDELPDAQKAEDIVQPILNALGDDYPVSCQGTAFFPLQSCMNHSCWPNAKAFKREEDIDGQASIISLRPISEGEEELPFEERQTLLADYGFTCRCPRCLRQQ